MTLSFNLAPGVSLGDAVKAIKDAEQPDWASRKYPGEFPRNGPSVSVVAFE